jgi:transcription elongation factor Elf1
MSQDCYCLRCGHESERAVHVNFIGGKIVLTACRSCEFVTTIYETGMMTARTSSNSWDIVPKGCLLIMDGVES